MQLIELGKSKMASVPTAATAGIVAEGSASTAAGGDEDKKEEKEQESEEESDGDGKGFWIFGDDI